MKHNVRNDSECHLLTNTNHKVSITNTCLPDLIKIMRREWNPLECVDYYTECYCWLL